MSRRARRALPQPSYDEEAEVTRCVCSSEVLVPPENDPFFTEEAAGLFISCEHCKVWQHGWCVGFKLEEAVPDKYYCELCRPELHTLTTDAAGRVHLVFLRHPRRRPAVRADNEYENDLRKALAESAKMLEKPVRAARSREVTEDEGSEVPAEAPRKRQRPAKKAAAVLPAKDLSGADRPAVARVPAAKAGLPEMRKRVLAIFEFITRTQVELAQEGAEHTSLAEAVRETEGLEGAEVRVFEGEKVRQLEGVLERARGFEERYRERFEVMERLTRRLVEWERVYGE